MSCTFASNLYLFSQFSYAFSSKSTFIFNYFDLYFCYCIRAALELLAPALAGNAFTALQALWGGSHDAILGLLFWLYKIDAYSLFNTYFDRTGLTVDIIDRINKTAVLVHRVKHMRVYPRAVKKITPTSPYRRIPSQHDIAAYFNDDATSDADLAQLGKEAFESLIPLMASGVNKTVYKERAEALRRGEPFTMFAFQDCDLISTP